MGWEPKLCLIVDDLIETLIAEGEWAISPEDVCTSLHEVEKQSHATSAMWYARHRDIPTQPKESLLGGSRPIVHPILSPTLSFALPPSPSLSTKKKRQFIDEERIGSIPHYSQSQIRKHVGWGREKPISYGKVAQKTTSAIVPQDHKPIKQKKHSPDKSSFIHAHTKQKRTKERKMVRKEDHEESSAWIAPSQEGIEPKKKKKISYLSDLLSRWDTRKAQWPSLIMGPLPR